MSTYSGNSPCTKWYVSFQCAQSRAVASSVSRSLSMAWRDSSRPARTWSRSTSANPPTMPDRPFHPSDATTNAAVSAKMTEGTRIKASRVESRIGMAWPDRPTWLGFGPFYDLAREDYLANGQALAEVPVETL